MTEMKKWICTHGHSLCKDDDKCVCYVPKDYTPFGCILFGWIMMDMDENKTSWVEQDGQ